MNREMRELQQKLAAAEQAARLAIGEGNVEAAEKHMEDVRALRKQIEMLEELEAEAKREAEAARPASERRDEREFESRYTEVFLKAVRRRRLSADDLEVINAYMQPFRAVMHQGGVGTDPDGDSSLVVPQDIQTRINEVIRSFVDLSEVIRRETVNTLSGSRVLEKDEDMTPLAVVNEFGQIGETDNPKFIGISYQLVKRAGFLPLTNELLADSDQNLIAYVSDWIGRKVVVTRNTLIAGLLSGMTPQTITDHGGLRKILNVDLDPAISASATILTNQDGFNWLDEQEDDQGRPLLQPDPTQPTRMLYKGRPIVVVANRFLPSRVATNTFAPFYVGNLRQLAVLFTRGVFELASTREGGEAWRRDTTEMRVITRDDVKFWDTGAAVFAEAQVA